MRKLQGIHNRSISRKSFEGSQFHCRVGINYIKSLHKIAFSFIANHTAIKRRSRAYAKVLI